MTHISPAEAVRQYDVSKPTLYADMNNGKLSFQKDARKKRKLNVAELERLYELRKANELVKALSNVKGSKKDSEPNVNTDQLLTMELMKQEIAFLKKSFAEKEEEAEKWEAAFKKAQDGQNRITHLLENKSNDSGNDEWKKTVKALEARIANQEKIAKEKAEREEKILRHNKMLRKNLEKEQSKSLFQKLFGS